MVRQAGGVWRAVDRHRLIVGAFVGIAAFFGAFMNMNFMLAGSASTNPVLFVVALTLIFAWKNAGYIGADFFLLKWLGTPWGRGRRSTVEKPLGVSSAVAVGD